MPIDRIERTRQTYAPNPDEDIVERLRQWEGEYHYPAGLLNEAAATIEGLRKRLGEKSWEGHVDRMSGAYDEWEKSDDWEGMGK